MLNLHYLPETITAQVGDGSDLGVRVRYSFESPVLGSAGGPRKALSAAAGRAVLHHQRRHAHQRRPATRSPQTIARPGALVTIAVIPNDRPDRYGGLIVDSTGRFHSVVPRGSRVRSYHVVGVQMAHPSAFARLPLNEPAESIGGAVQRARREKTSGTCARSCATADFWDVGTPADYLDACLSIGRAEGDRARRSDGGPIVDRSARVTDSVIWDDVSVGAGATLERCIVADGVKIPAGASFRNCAIIQRDGELVVADIT